MSKFIQIARKSEIPKGSAKCVEVEGRRIAVFNLGDEFFGIDDVCPHAGAPLSEGTVDGGEVECPWHGARFNLKTGDVLAPPAEEGVKKYAIRVTGDLIEVEI